MSEFTNLPEIIEQAKKDDAKSILPYVGNQIKILDGETDSPVIPVKGFRGIGLNLPALTNVKAFSIYVSPTNVPLGQPGSLMAKHSLIEDIVPNDTASTTDRLAWSSSYIAEHWFVQIVADVDEQADYEYEYTLS